MKISPGLAPPGLKVLYISALLLFCTQLTSPAQVLDQIGVTALRAVTTNLNGAGIRAAQPEAEVGTNPPAFEVDPATVGENPGFFAYITSTGSASVYPNNVGTNSQHAEGVGATFYGNPSGVATNIAHVDNYDANYFVQGSMVAGNYLINLPATNIDDPVVNQSFTFGNVDTNEQKAIDSAYDNYAAQYSTLFVSAANNGGPVSPPGTSYNCICVGAYGGGSSYGPTLDNGRAKPDLTAPAGETSFSTPQVAGAAALLMQAGLRGDGGNDTNSAFDIRTIKALLLNGAVKPADWTNIPPYPLDTNYGTGVLNVLNSYEELAGGKHGFVVSTSVSIGAAHPPNGATGSIATLSGWDFNTNSSGSTSDTVKHYYFNVTNQSAGVTFAATATLVWNRQQGQSDINNLNLFLYSCANSNLVASSTSMVDNVEHIYLPQLAPGRYDLQVWKAGGIPGLAIVSAAEPYALAFAFVPQPILAISDGSNPVLGWPVYPAGFLVESTTNLIVATWNTNDLPAPGITNGSNYILLEATNACQFFRLSAPNL